jgi:hypothetical protein
VEDRNPRVRRNLRVPSVEYTRIHTSHRFLAARAAFPDSFRRKGRGIRGFCRGIPWLLHAIARLRALPRPFVRPGGRACRASLRRGDGSRRAWRRFTEGFKWINEVSVTTGKKSHEGRRHHATHRIQPALAHRSLNGEVLQSPHRLFPSTHWGRLKQQAGQNGSARRRVPLRTVPLTVKSRRIRTNSSTPTSVSPSAFRSPRMVSPPPAMRRRARTLYI